MTNEAKRRLIVARLTARGWKDPEFQQALIDNPRPILEQAGLKLPDDIEIKGIANTATTQYIVIPKRPDWVRDSDLSSMAVMIPLACGYDFPPIGRPKYRPGRTGSGRAMAGAAVGGGGAAKKKVAKGAKAAKRPGKRSGGK